MIRKDNGLSGFSWQNGGTTHPSILIKNVSICGTLWISSSIHHITLKSDYKDSSSGGPYRVLTRCSKTIERQLGYSTKYDEITSTSTSQLNGI